jgi:hypothetical protein
MRCRPFLSLMWAVTSRYWIHSLFAKTIASIYIESSVGFLFSNFNDLKVSIAETYEKSVSESIPGNRSNLVEFVSFGLLWLFLFKALFSLKFKVSFSNHWSVFSFEVPNLPSNFSSNSDPVASRVEGKAVNWRSGIMAWSRLLNITEIKDSDFLIFSSCHNKVSSRRNSDSINASVVDFDAVLNVECLVIPDFKIAIPSNWCEVLSSDWGLWWSGDKSNFWDPVVMIKLLDSVFAVTLNVPELDISIRSWGENVSSVWGNSTRKNFFAVSIFWESLGSLASS